MLMAAGILNTTTLQHQNLILFSSSKMILYVIDGNRRPQNAKKR